MENNSKTILIDISNIPSIVENIHIGADCSLEEIKTYTALFRESCDVFSCCYEEIPGIDPWIVQHEIKNFPNVKHVQQKLGAKPPPLRLKLENYINQYSLPDTI